MAKKITTAGIFTAVALILNYMEMLLPFNIGIPGIKPGLANLVVLLAIYLLPPAEAFAVAICRILLAGLFSGNGIALAFSLAGGLSSFFIMLACFKSNCFSPTGVSLAGGAVHNIAQFTTALLLLQTQALLLYLPFLLPAGIAAGFCNGLLAAKLLPRLGKSINH